MTELQKFLWYVLCDMDGEEVARVFTYYYGNQLLDEGFLQFMKDEGYIEEDAEI